VDASEPTVEELLSHIANLYLAFDIFMWDYHCRHHVNDDKPGSFEYKACLKYPCNILSLYILSRQSEVGNG
jgi:hypothetical protein